jgi:GWxTD domain-containing protein
MRRQRLVILVSFALAIILAPAADAQLSEYADWDEGPEGFLLTKKEKKEWAKIKTDAEAERFIELFWAKRNPELHSSFNRFRDEFERKVAFADKNFGFGKHRGALSARGQVLILMGRPDSRQVRGIDGAPTVTGGSGEFGDVEGNTEAWYYDPVNLPEGFKAKGAQLYFFFYEERLDSNAYELDRTNRESFKAMSVLNRAPDVYLLHPNLKEVPKPISIYGGEPASAAHLAWLDGEAPLDDIAKVFSELGVSDETNRPLWVHLELPPDAPPLDLLAGRVTESKGEVVSNFEIAPTPIEGQYGPTYHLAFPLDVGLYTVEIVGASGGEPQLIRSITTDVSTVPEQGTWLSPVWLGTTATPEPEAPHGSAFTIGGWHLTPISGPELTSAHEIAYFGFVVRPDVGEDGATAVRARIRVKRDGQELGRPLEIPLGTSRIGGDLHMYGNSIGLGGFPELGSYEIIFEIIETNSDTVVEKTLNLELTE